MNTPGEVLLKQHRAAATKLDRIRSDVLARECGASLRSQETPVQGAVIRVLITVWSELIAPCRRAWVVLGCVWLVVCAFELGAPRPPVNPRVNISSAAVAAALEQRNRFLAELSLPEASPPEPPPQARTRRRQNLRPA